MATRRPVTDLRVLVLLAALGCKERERDGGLPDAGRAVADAGREASRRPDECPEPDRPCECAVAADGGPIGFPDAAPPGACDAGAPVCPGGEPFVGDPCSPPRVRLAEHQHVEQRVRLLSDGDEVELFCCNTVSSNLYLPLIVAATNVCPGDATARVVLPETPPWPAESADWERVVPLGGAAGWVVSSPRWDPYRLWWGFCGAVGQVDEPLFGRPLWTEFGIEDATGRRAWDATRIVPVCGGASIEGCRDKHCRAARAEWLREFCECVCGGPFHYDECGTCMPGPWEHE